MSPQGGCSAIKIKFKKKKKRKGKVPVAKDVLK
jgi:hypothetical protein